jgi:general secretion pathway protein E
VEPSTRPRQIFKAEGCAACKYTGYHGRMGIFEMMLVDDDVRSMVSRSIDAKTIKKTAVSKGMSTLRHDGAHKVLAGITSIAEVLRATEEEGSIAQI